MEVDVISEELDKKDPLNHSAKLLPDELMESSVDEPDTRYALVQRLQFLNQIQECAKRDVAECIDMFGLPAVVSCTHRTAVPMTALVECAQSRVEKKMERITEAQLKQRERGHATGPSQRRPTSSNKATSTTKKNSRVSSTTSTVATESSSSQPMQAVAVSAGSIASGSIPTTQEDPKLQQLVQQAVAEQLARMTTLATSSTTTTNHSTTTLPTHGDSPPVTHLQVMDPSSSALPQQHQQQLQLQQQQQEGEGGRGGSTQSGSKITSLDHIHVEHQKMIVSQLVQAARRHKVATQGKPTRNTTTGLSPKQPQPHKSHTHVHVVDQGDEWKQLTLSQHRKHTMDSATSPSHPQHNKQLLSAPLGHFHKRLSDTSSTSSRDSARDTRSVHSGTSRPGNHLAVRGTYHHPQSVRQYSNHKPNSAQHPTDATVTTQHGTGSNNRQEQGPLRYYNKHKHGNSPKEGGHPLAHPHDTTGSSDIHPNTTSSSDSQHTDSVDAVHNTDFQQPQQHINPSESRHGAQLHNTTPLRYPLDADSCTEEDERVVSHGDLKLMGRMRRIEEQVRVDHNAINILLNKLSQADGDSTGSTANKHLIQDVQDVINSKFEQFQRTVLQRLQYNNSAQQHQYLQSLQKHHTDPALPSPPHPQLQEQQQVAGTAVSLLEESTLTSAGGSGGGGSGEEGGGAPSMTEQDDEVEGEAGEWTGFSPNNSSIHATTIQQGAGINTNVNVSVDLFDALLEKLSSFDTKTEQVQQSLKDPKKALEHQHYQYYTAMAKVVNDTNAAPVTRHILQKYYEKRQHSEHQLTTPLHQPTMGVPVLSHHLSTEEESNSETHSPTTTSAQHSVHFLTPPTNAHQPASPKTLSFNNWGLKSCLAQQPQSFHDRHPEFSSTCTQLFKRDITDITNTTDDDDNLIVWKPSVNDYQHHSLFDNKHNITTETESSVILMEEPLPPQIIQTTSSPQVEPHSQTYNFSSSATARSQSSSGFALGYIRPEVAKHIKQNRDVFMRAQQTGGLHSVVNMSSQPMCAFANKATEDVIDFVLKSLTAEMGGIHTAFVEECVLANELHTNAIPSLT